MPREKAAKKMIRERYQRAGFLFRKRFAVFRRNRA